MSLLQQREKGMGIVMSSWQHMNKYAFTTRLSPNDSQFKKNIT